MVRAEAPRSVTWDPFPPAPLAYREKTRTVCTRRRSGVPTSHPSTTEVPVCVGAVADQDPDGEDFGPRGSEAAY